MIIRQQRDSPTAKSATPAIDRLLLLSNIHFPAPSHVQSDKDTITSIRLMG